MTTLAGIVCIRNGTRLDYCWREAVLSLLGVCDECVICDCDSDDGTRGLIDEWASNNPRISVCNFAWTDPRGSNQWWLDFLNYARQHAKSEWVCFLDADEVLHENSYEIVRRAADNRSTLFCHRYNFWRDAQSVIPHGHCCGWEVLRVGPKNMTYPSDYPRPDGLDQPLIAQAVKSNVQIMHYGFLRERQAFFRKAREVLRIWNDDFDPRLEAAEKEGGNWATHSAMPEWVNQLVPFTGTHPEIIKPWLRERGFTNV
jgi:glycosyltransferase involved in cell wall biosynthesis